MANQHTKTQQARISEAPRGLVQNALSGEQGRADYSNEMREHGYPRQGHSDCLNKLGVPMGLGQSAQPASIKEPHLMDRAREVLVYLEGSMQESAALLSLLREAGPGSSMSSDDAPASMEVMLAQMAQFAAIVLGNIRSIANVVGN